MTDSSVKKDVQKLQRAIIDGLEDVKAQDIVVFNTEHLSALFERVVIASGTSNRQTKALAASVRDKVREAGFPKPRIEGEENGEWIIIDCGQAVVHVMQPAIRQYYHLEEIWGDKPVRLKLGAPKPVLASAGAGTRSGKSGATAKTASKATRATKATKATTESSTKPAAKSPARKTTRSGTSAAAPAKRKPASAGATAKTAPRKAAAKKGSSGTRARTSPKA